MLDFACIEEEIQQKALNQVHNDLAGLNWGKAYKVSGRSEQVFDEITGYHRENQRLIEEHSRVLLAQFENKLAADIIKEISDKT